MGDDMDKNIPNPMPNLDPDRVNEFMKGFLGHSPGERRDKKPSDKTAWQRLVDKFKKGDSDGGY